MKQRRSIDEALTAAKELRKNLAYMKVTPQPDSDSHLKVVDSLKISQEEQPNIPRPTSQAATTVDIGQSANFITNLKPVWVRHTIGLRDTTSLSLRDAADGQKRKERHGQLGREEPANEQEIADLGIRLALRELGYLDKETNQSN